MPKVGEDTLVGGLAGRRKPPSNGLERKELWHRADLGSGLPVAACLLGDPGESLALSEHLFPHLVKRMRTCHCLLIKPVMES